MAWTPGPHEHSTPRRDATLDVSGHPATTVPAGLCDGLPAGMMIVGHHHADTMCLRVAQAYESAVSGFPTPPGN